MQHNLFSEVETTTSSLTCGKPTVSRSILYQGDCLVEMDKITDKSVDMILCDLPYGTTQCKWDSIIPFKQLWKQYGRIIKDNGAIVLFGSEPFSSYLRLSNMNIYKYDWYLRKNKTTGFLNAKKQPLRKYELVSIFYKKQCTYNPQFYFGKKHGTGGYKDKDKTEIYGNQKPKIPYETNVYYPNNELELLAVQDVLHPTQKPIELMEYLIKTYTNEGETVLDNCMGSGTTGVACQNTNRHFIGIEKDEKYFEIAVKRIIPIVDLNETTCQHYFSKNKTGLCDNCGKNLICHWKSFG